MWLSDLRLVLPDRVIERGSLHIEGDTLHEIVQGPPPAGTAHVLSAPGLTAMPGIIDLHGDMLERDIEPRPGARFPVALALYELDKRLAAAGVTTAYAAVSFAWSRDDLRSQEKAQEIITTVQAMRHELLVDFRVHARFEVTNPGTAPILKGLLERHLVQLVSVMDHTPGQGQYRNVDRYVDFMSKWLGFDPTQIDSGLIERIKSAIIAQVGVPRNWSIVEEVTRTAREHGIPIASHDDDTAEKVARMAELGVTISEFPVSMLGAQEARQRGMHVIMGAPNAYRGASTSEGNLSARQAIAAGVVDILATDYFPAAPFQAALLLAEEAQMPLHESVKLVSQNAADAIGLADRGQLAVGCKADVVLFEDRSPHPRVRATLRHGVPIYWDSTMVRLAQQQHFSFAPTRRESV